MVASLTHNYGETPGSVLTRNYGETTNEPRSIGGQQMTGTLSEKLSRHRSAAALSLRDVEKQTGISKANLSKLERGIHKNPTLDTLTALAGCYGVTVGALIGEATR